jgi:large subunit ribosomal protein L13
MDSRSYKTLHANTATVTRKWWIVDADGQTLGRLSSQIASVLRGKHKADFTTHFDNGDCVIVLNAGKVLLTGSKMEDKEMLTYSLYPGGQKSTTPKRMLEKFPTRLLEKAVKGMLPKTSLGRQQIKKLHLFEGSEHNHAAQQPQPLKLTK